MGTLSRPRTSVSANNLENFFISNSFLLISHGRHEGNLTKFWLLTRADGRSKGQALPEAGMPLRNMHLRVAGKANVGLCSNGFSSDNHARWPSRICRFHEFAARAPALQI